MTVKKRRYAKVTIRELQQYQKGKVIKVDIIYIVRYNFYRKNKVVVDEVLHVTGKYFKDGVWRSDIADWPDRYVKFLALSGSDKFERITQEEALLWSV
jgi:hypothetical protein